MESPEDLMGVVQRLEARIQALESLYGLVDLLAVPGLLAGGAARIFDSLQSAETMAAQTPGFYGKEAAGRGVTIRWTRYPDPGNLNVAVIGGIPFSLALRTLHMPHVGSGDDVVLTTSEGERIVFDTVDHLENGVIELGAVIVRPATGLLRLSVTSRAPLDGSGGDTRQLGLPFIQLHARPKLAISATE